MAASHTYVALKYVLHTSDTMPHTTWATMNTSWALTPAAGGPALPSHPPVAHTAQNGAKLHPNDESAEHRPLP